MHSLKSATQTKLLLLTPSATRIASPMVRRRKTAEKSLLLETVLHLSELLAAAGV